MRVTVTRVLLALIGTVTLTSIVVPMVLIDLDSALGEPGTIRNRIRDSYVQDGSGVQWSASSNNVGVVDALANTDRRDGSQSGVRTGAIDSSASTMQGRVADQQQQARPAVNTNDVEQPCRCKTQPGQDWVGGDLGSSNAHSPAQCCQLCEDHPQCYSWTYKEETSECFLKEAHLQMVTGSSTLTSGKACKIAPPPPAPTPTPPRPKAPSRAHAAEEVRAAMKHAWDGYTSHCFGQDELYPVSGKCGNWLGQGLTVIDAMSTLHVMGFQDEFTKAKDWVAHKLRFDQNMDVSFFETVIRIMGGLMSAFDMSGDRTLVDRGVQLEKRLAPVFGGGAVVPWGHVNLQTGKTKNPSWSGGSSILSEIGTIQLEYFSLSRHSGDDSYRKKAQHVIDVLEKAHPYEKGLYPIFINTKTGRFSSKRVTFGGCGDSFYEYLLKMWLLTGKTNSQYRRMYVESTEAMIQNLVIQKGGRWYVAEMSGPGSLSHNMEHLTCFVPGMLALGASSGILRDEAMAANHLRVAKDLTETCYQMYRQVPTGISPESSSFTNAGIKPRDKAYHMRPEVLESIFILFRVTGDSKYRDYGWTIFESIIEHCKVPKGFSGLKDVSRVGSGRIDKMESFFLAETLKYLYLLFSEPSTLPLAGIDDATFPDGDLWVFNTEAHPIKVWKN